MNLKVAIPLKTNSERVPNKNLRDFYKGKSLFDIKAEQLLKVFNPGDIWVSSENKDVAKICERYGFNFHLRPFELTLRTAKENEIVSSVVNAIPGKPDIMWCQVTQPLFNEFEELIDIYRNLPDENDSIVVVKKLAHHILDEKGNPLNFNFGYWHKISQDLPKLYEITWSAFIMRRDMLEQAWYQIGRNPYLMETNAILMDINELNDFKAAQVLYKYLIENTEILD